MKTSIKLICAIIATFMVTGCNHRFKPTEAPPARVKIEVAETAEQTTAAVTPATGQM